MAWIYFDPNYAVMGQCPRKFHIRTGGVLSFSGQRDMGRMQKERSAETAASNGSPWWRHDCSDYHAIWAIRNAENCEINERSCIGHYRRVAGAGFFNHTTSPFFVRL